MARTGLAFALLVISFGLGWPVAEELTAVDRCLDVGGSYDYTARRCDFKVSHAIPALWQRHALPLLGCLALGWIGCALLLGKSSKR